MVFFSNLSEFGPRRGRRGVSERPRSRRWRLRDRAAAMASARRHATATPSTRPHESLRTASSEYDAPRRREKLRKDISFPRRGLDLSKFLPAEAYAVYDLFGVINHLGSLSGGHYTAHVRVSPCSSDGVEEASIAFEESERWLHIDDDLVELSLIHI